jgi:hypothetical protein
MPTKAQIKARKAFVKKYAKKGKAKSSKSKKTEAGMTGHVEDDWTRKDERELHNDLLQRGFSFKKVPTSSKKKGTIDLHRKLIYV